jgi:MoxR-like ATPase
MESTEIQQHEIAEIEEFADKRDTMISEIRKVIVGQDRVIEEVLIALFAKGHCLLVGVPGLAKTLLISTLAEILDLEFNRIQFTPDLMPSDITGTDILQEDPATRRRNQSDAAKDSSRAFAIDAGIQSDRRRNDLPAGPAFLCFGDPKSY